METNATSPAGRWVSLVEIAELRARQRVAVEIDGSWIAAVVVTDRIFAFEDLCSHEAVPLLDGDIEGTEIRCPFHGARFCLLTGAALTPPAHAPIRTFATREVEGRLQVLIRP